MPLSGSHERGGAEQKYGKEAFDTNWVVPMGPNVNAFEQSMAEFSNGKADGSKLDRWEVCLSAGTTAVHLALPACGVGQGEEVIVQDFAFCASLHAPLSRRLLLGKGRDLQCYGLKSFGLMG